MSAVDDQSLQVAHKAAKHQEAHQEYFPSFEQKIARSIATVLVPDMLGVVHLDQSGDATFTPERNISGTQQRGRIHRRRSGLISDEEIRHGKPGRFLLSEQNLTSFLASALNAGEAVSPSYIIERGLGTASSASESHNGHPTPTPHRLLNGLPTSDIQINESVNAMANQSEDYKMNTEVEEGYINVTASQANIHMAASEGRIHGHHGHEVSASTSSASNTSSHRIHTRETTAEYPSASRIPLSHDATNIRRLQSEVEWLYERNAELQDEIENLKAEATTKEREHRQGTRRLQTEVDTLQNALEEAGRQNRTLEATIKHLRMQRLENRGEGTQTVGGTVRAQGLANSRSESIRGIPATTSVTDSLVTNDSVDTDSILDSRVTDSERDIAETHQDLGSIANRRIRKKVSWQDEIGASRTLFSRPAPPPINVPSASLPVAGIMKTSPQKLHHERPSSESPPSMQAHHLSQGPSGIPDWVNVHPSVRRSQRRPSDTPSPGLARSLFEELKAAGQLQPSTSQMSLMSGQSTMRPASETALSNPAEDSRDDALDDDSTGAGDSEIGAAQRNDQDSTIIERCTAILEDRGNDFWQRLQFYCIVGVFLAGVLSKGRDGVMELGKRR